MSPTLTPLDALGIAVGAVAGAIAGRGRGIDLFGACFLGFITAFGGGTVRDVILQQPVTWVQNWQAPTLVFFVALGTFFIARRQEDAAWIEGRAFWWADTCTLALFTVSGCSKAHTMGVPVPGALILGMFSGVAGGILRDVLLGQVPHVFHRQQHFYATAALMGAGVQLALARYSVEWSTVAGAVVVVLTRLLSYRFDVSWPSFSETDG